MYVVMMVGMYVGMMVGMYVGTICTVGTTPCT